MSVVRLGVVGLAFGRYLAQTVARLDGARLAAVADSAPGKKDSLADISSRYGATAYTDGVEMIEKEKLDGLLVAVSPKWRAPILEHAAKKGLPMFVEKPWAADMKQAHELADICRRNNATVMLGFSFRFLPAVTRLRQLMDGELGAGWMLNGNYTFGWIPPADYWLWDPANGNGYFNENSGHIFDVVCHLMGRPATVMAQARNFSSSPSEDCAAITLGFRDGGIAALTIGGVGTSAIKEFPSANVYTQHGQALLRGVDQVWKTVHWAKRGDDVAHTFESSPESMGNTRYTCSLTHFVECITSGQQPSATIDDGIMAVALAEAIYESARSGRTVEIA